MSYGHKVFLGKETILVVDDNNGDRKLMSLALTQHGYRVLEACDAKEGLQIFQAYLKKIELILIDIVMPGMNGLELAERIRVISPTTKIFFISGYKRKFAGEIGATNADFIKKADLPHLVWKVHEALSKGRLPISKVDRRNMVDGTIAVAE